MNSKERFSASRHIGDMRKPRLVRDNLPKLRRDEPLANLRNMPLISIVVSRGLKSIEGQELRVAECYLLFGACGHDPERIDDHPCNRSPEQRGNRISNTSEPVPFCPMQAEPIRKRVEARSFTYGEYPRKRRVQGTRRRICAALATGSGP